MFTGIIEHLGTLESLAVTGSGSRISIHAPTLAPSLAISQSIAVNGCCLTVTAVEGKIFSADLSPETLSKTSFGASPGPLRGARLNLEKPLTAGQEFGGHFVLGHVDGVGRITEIQHEDQKSDNWRLRVEIPADLAGYIVPKGSITIDGISLTVASCNRQEIEAAIIPYTWQHTSLRDCQAGQAVNIEADVLGKYVERYLEAREKNKG